MRKKVVAKTLRELIDKIAKNEGKSRQDYSSLLQMEQALLPAYVIKPDYERNQFVATRKLCDCGKPVMVGTKVCVDCAVEAYDDIVAGVY